MFWTNELYNEYKTSINKSVTKINNRNTEYLNWIIEIQSCRMFGNIAIANYQKCFPNFCLITNNFFCVKSVSIRSYSGPHFPAFGLNTDRYGVSLRIYSECGKMWIRITPNTDTFHAVFNCLIAIRNFMLSNFVLFHITPNVPNCANDILVIARQLRAIWQMRQSIQEWTK